MTIKLLIQYSRGDWVEGQVIAACWIAQPLVRDQRRPDAREHGVADGSLGKGGFLQVSGILFTYDRARPSGSRLVGEITRVGGAALAAGDTVQVVMPAYPACEGGDGYSIPEAAASCAQASAGPRAADLLIRFMSDSLGGKVALPQGGRIVQAASSPG